ncbi:MAG: endonuclease/exonuclease/phosphatase family protein [Alphaproteobacteria bacterium]
MKIVTYNIQFGSGRDGRIDLGRIAQAVDGADVIALQEVDRNWRRSGMTDQVAELATLLNGYHWVFGPYFDVDASSREADGSLTNRRRQFGTMLLSKMPILSSRLFCLPKSASVERHNMHTGALEGIIEANGRAVRFYSLHLAAFWRRDRVAQIGALLDIVRRAPREGGTWTGKHTHRYWIENNENAPPMPEDAILLGDFNLQPTNPEYDLLAGPHDGAGGRLTYQEGFVDAWVAAGHDENDGATFPASSGNELTHDLRLDYAFVTESLARRVRSAEVDMAAQGSDHQPFWIDIDW